MDKKIIKKIKKLKEELAVIRQEKKKIYNKNYNKNYYKIKKYGNHKAKINSKKNVISFD
jgi:uncharacterized protein (UPF0335 family)